ncbi:MAG: DNA cytosine methyltransferase, partial [Caulobacteraceae bacterium]|nr:DNA cytosine methyltransferase [Caulobacter sp.]
MCGRGCGKASFLHQGSDQTSCCCHNVAIAPNGPGADELQPPGRGPRAAGQITAGCAPVARPPFTAYEFFAGGGMARAGLGSGWRTAFANDLDPGKAAAYALNGEALRLGDVWALEAADLPGRADLAWASSPCQDLSLAGRRLGLEGARSSAFWGFHRLLQGLAADGRLPRAVVVENVAGLLTSGGGTDFAALVAALARLGYTVGALEIDAARFTPQSRPRLFVVAAQAAAPGLALAAPEPPFHGARLREAHARLSADLQARWAWWRLPTPPARNLVLADLLELDAPWDASAQTARLMALLSPLHAARLELERVRSRAAPGLRAGTLFRRTRAQDGRRVQRAEVRFDGVAGCLRTPRGGSSRQVVVAVEDGAVRSRKLTPREG